MRSPSFRASRSAPGFASLYDYLRLPGDLRIPESALQVTLYVATKADLTRLVESIHRSGAAGTGPLDEGPGTLQALATTEPCARGNLLRWLPPAGPGLGWPPAPARPASMARAAGL
jgi:hypothetical protein